MPETAKSSLPERIRQFVEQLTLHDPPFPLQVGWASDYESLLGGSFGSVTPVDDIVSIAREDGRVLLCGRGGSGKTTAISRIAKRLIANAQLPILVSLREWAPPDYEAWKALDGDQIGRINYLLKRLARPSVDFAELDYCVDQPYVVFVDGLNEMQPGTATQILAVLDLLASIAPRTTVVATDRLSRRSLSRPDRWRLAQLLPLKPEQVDALLTSEQRARLVGNDLGLLESPYFLDEFLNERSEVVAGFAARFEHWFKRHVSLSEQQLSTAARAAFVMYAQHRDSRQFPFDEFCSLTSEEICRRLEQGGSLVTRSNLAWFAHHLQHDFLAARDLSGRSNDWDYDNLNAITFTASSFDSLALTSELVAEELGDSFMRHIYDWQVYAPAYVIGESTHGWMRRTYSNEMRLVMLAVIAERRFDLMHATVQRSEDALAFCAMEEAVQLHKASSFADLVAIVAAWPSGAAWFESWRRLFSTPAGSPVADEEIGELWQEDSITGWTLANVLRRRPLTPEQLSRIADHVLKQSEQSDDAARRRETALRWRAVHVLGAHPSAQTLQALRQVLEELLSSMEFQWLGYGTIRAIVELAARASTQMRDEAFQMLADLAPEIQAAASGYRQELIRALLLVPGREPALWLTRATDLLFGCLGSSNTIEEREYWLKAIAQLQGHFVEERKRD